MSLLQEQKIKGPIVKGSPDPIDLFIRRWAPDGVKAVKTLVIVHGYSEHSGRYSHVAEYFAARGYEVYALDLPGHGLSGGRRSDIGAFSDYTKSVEMLVLHILSQKAPEPFYILGHSLGGLITLRFMQTSPLASHFKKVAVSSPLLGLGRFAPMILPWLNIFTYLIPNRTLNNQSELGTDVLTHDPAMTASRLADPLIKSSVTPHWVRAFIGARILAFKQAAAMKTPIALFQSGDDRVVSRSEAERFFELITAPKQIKVYEGFYHELFNELDRARPLADVESWFSQS